MAKQNTGKKNQKKYLRLRKNHAWVTTMLFFIIACSSVIVVMVFAEIFTLFVINSDVETEFESKQALTVLYEEGVSDGEDLYQIFDMAEMTYYIEDKAGNLIHAQGENTRAANGGFLSMSAKGLLINYTVEDTPQKKIMVYADTEKPIVFQNNSQYIAFDLQTFFKEVRTLLRDANRNPRSVEQENEKFQLPLWEAIPMKGGSETLYFKAYVSFTPSNIVMAAVMMIILILLIFLVFVAMVIHAISSGLNQRRLNKMLFTDMKTRGNNWTWFLVHTGHFLRKPGSARKSYAVVNLEFVDYRRFVICHSVEEGDAMILAIYQRLCKLLKRNEICAHNSEGSFSLLLRGGDTESLKTRMQGILADLGRINEEHSFVYHAGIYPVPAEEKPGLLAIRRNFDVEAAYHHAVAACVSIEGMPGSRIAFYDEKLIEEQRWIDTVEEMQQRAVAQEEFIVYYQPKYDPRTHELRGAEALIRWQSPEYGFLPPYKFIPIFEENGFITEIDHYMLSHVARAQRYWLDEGQQCVPISVNVSRAHFIENDLAEQICDTVDREHVPHELIEIELTESAFFDDKFAMIQTIVKLKEYGFAVSMDDFGAGYSSLNSLKDMPLDVLKLDADFFRGVSADSNRGEIIVSETIRLAKSLKMRTVAEGVEVKEQVQFLAEQGCDMIQGYYFAKPMPADEYRERMIQRINDGQEPAAVHA